MSYRDPHADHAAYAGFHDALRKVNRTTGLVCSGFQRGLSALLDGELAEEVRHHVHHHLDACPDCQQAFEFHLELKQAIRRKCSEDALPDSLISRLEVCLTEDFDGDGVIGDEG